MLYIITPCSRPQNLLEISKTIPNESQWIICSDNKVKMPYIQNAILMQCNDTGQVGTLARNYILDNFQFNQEDWILAHDDDNIIHPELYSNIKQYLDSDYSIVYWGQLEKESIRISLETVFPIANKIDSSCYMVNWKYNSKVRHKVIYNHDGIYAEQCSQNGSSLKIDKYLCYYNYLKDNQ